MCVFTQAVDDSVVCIPVSTSIFPGTIIPWVKGMTMKMTDEGINIM